MPFSKPCSQYLPADIVEEEALGFLSSGWHKTHSESLTEWSWHQSDFSENFKFSLHRLHWDSGILCSSHQSTNCGRSVARSGLHFTHWDSGAPCSLHQSPLALNFANGSHSSHWDSGRLCSTHQSCEDLKSFNKWGLHW